MLKENYNSPCEFAEQMIAYLYDEAGAGEKNTFEAHLKNCRTCADEFAGFSSARSSVLEWREADFDSLAAPRFDIATITGAKPQIVVETEKSKSKFAGFWSNWIFNPAFATAAVLLLFVGAGIFVYLRQSSSEKDFAAIENKSSDKITTAPTAEKIREVSSENKNVEPDKKSTDAADKSVKTSIDKQNASVEKSFAPNEPVKVLTKVPKNKSINSQVPIENGDNIKPNKPFRKAKAPTLMNDEDDEDDSVRLTDLFAEIDTK